MDTTEAIAEIEAIKAEVKQMSTEELCDAIILLGEFKELFEQDPKLVIVHDALVELYFGELVSRN